MKLILLLALSFTTVSSFAAKKDTNLSCKSQKYLAKESNEVLRGSVNAEGLNVGECKIVITKNDLNYNYSFLHYQVNGVVLLRGKSGPSELHDTFGFGPDDSAIFETEITKTIEKLKESLNACACGKI
ncbi:MAG: hypothetical protein ACOYL6_08450 [Bacteriovoracaceae bacterium]